jgi:hypothetical protein
MIEYIIIKKHLSGLNERITKSDYKNIYLSFLKETNKKITGFRVILKNDFTPKSTSVFDNFFILSVNYNKD